MRFSTEHQQRFAKLLFPMLGLCIVAVAILMGFAVVDGTSDPDPHKNYYLLLDAKERELEAKLKAPPGVNIDKMRDLALVLWQNNKIEFAEPYLRTVWNLHQSKNTTTYDQEFVQDGLNAAHFYVDRGSHELAIEIYERLIGYDTAHKNYVALARDWNDLGLCYLQKGEATKEWNQRKVWFDKALEQFGKAETFFRTSMQYEPQLVCNLQNQVVANSELGNDNRALQLSNVVNRELDSWHDEHNLTTAGKTPPEHRI